MVNGMGSESQVDQLTGIAAWAGKPVRTVDLLRRRVMVVVVDTATTLVNGGQRGMARSGTIGQGRAAAQGRKKY